MQMWKAIEFRSLLDLLQHPLCLPLPLWNSAGVRNVTNFIFLKMKTKIWADSSCRSCLHTLSDVSPELHSRRYTTQMHTHTHSNQVDVPLPYTACIHITKLSMCLCECHAWKFASCRRSKKKVLFRFGYFSSASSSCLADFWHIFFGSETANKLTNCRAFSQVQLG